MDLNLLGPIASVDKPIAEDKPQTTWDMMAEAPETTVHP